jgi:hypothetical protein
VGRTKADAVTEKRKIEHDGACAPKRTGGPSMRLICLGDDLVALCIAIFAARYRVAQPFTAVLALQSFWAVLQDP